MPVDTVYHEMDSIVCSHHVYKSVWLSVIGEQLVLEKEPAGQSTCTMNLKYVTVIKDSQIFGTPSENYSHADHMVLRYTKELCHPLSGVAILLGEEGKEQA